MEAFVIELSPEEEMLRGIIEPLLDSEGFELIKLSLKRSLSKSHLAIYVDTKARPNGIVMGNLEFVSRFLSDVFDASLEDKSYIRGSYELEISSPGLDRPLTKATHFTNALNQRIKLRLKNKDANGTRHLIGRLVLADAAELRILPEGKADELTIKYSDLAEGNLIFDFGAKGHRKKN